MLGSSVLGAVSGLFGGVVGSVVGRAVGKAAGFVLKGFDRGRVVRIVERVFGLGESNSARTAAKSEALVAQVTKNRIVGNEFRDLVASRLEAEEGFAIYGKEVGVKTPFGMRYIDILAERNGGLVSFETKLGGSRYLPGQRAKDWWISRVGVDLGDGSPTQIPTVVIWGPLE